MPYVTTLIAPRPAPFFDDAALKILGAAGIGPDDRAVLQKDRAVDLVTTEALPKETLDDLRATGIDAVCQPVGTRKKRLFMADMDATMVEQETLDELAAAIGIKDKVAAITQKAMNGELDFKQALRERVALLQGLPVTALDDAASAMTYTPGGAALLEALKADGVHCVLVSGGFTFFTGRVAHALGFDEHHGNRLEIEKERLTGRVEDPILDKAFKKSCLEDTARRLSVSLPETLAVGDGANDLPMLQTAGLGVGFHGKKLLRDALPNHIVHGGLDALIFVMGYAP